MNLAHSLKSRDPADDSTSLSDRLNYFLGREAVNCVRPIEHEASQPRWPGEPLLPELELGAFDANRLKSAIATSGALIVRGMLNSDEVAHFRDAVDRVVDGCREQEDEDGNPLHADGFYRNPPEAIKSLLIPEKLKNSRGFHRLSGSAMCIESASVSEQLLELYAAKGLRQLVGDYLGEPPCLSALKWVLRRSKLPIAKSGWHQDGAFMGSGINSINMWIPLDRCGGETGAPGLDVLPRRLTDIFRPGAESAIFSWSVGEEDIVEAFGENAVRSPVFEPGDAFFFDHFYLHRTQYRRDFTRPRYAIETWFFGEKNFPENQVPLRW